MKKIVNYIMLIITVLIPINVFAYSDYIIAGGQSIGITINTNGLLVVGTYDINGENLSESANVKIGDSIIEVNGFNINKVSDLINSLDADKCDNANIKLVRNNKIINTTLKLKLDNNICKTGLYVKDSITGIGTLTYIDPNTKIFGALGHEIFERSTGKIVETKDGTIFDSEVIDIKKSSEGEAGEKNARYYSSNIRGNIYENTNKGIFGYYEDNLNEEKLYKVASESDIKLGKAYIRTVVDGTKVEEYEINITKINKKQDTKNIVFEIVDKDLIDKAGGVVQGMSGSPIIQGEYIVGAVTHVVVETPEKGYGIFITNMLEESEN